MLARWLVPTLVYVAAVGALGVTSKLALRTLPWQALVTWTGLGYVCVTAFLLVSGQARLGFVHDTSWAVLSGVMAIGGLVALYLALTTGEASKVVPISAAYPAVTVLLSAAALSESVSLARAGGMALVVGGVIVLTTAH